MIQKKTGPYAEICQCVSLDKAVICVKINFAKAIK